METFQSNMRSLAKRVETLKDGISTEEATKMSLIVPFFQYLGYDVFNPQEFMPEYTADVGIKKGEKVDYAILENNAPIILIEAKAVNEKLDNHDSQLFRYFGVSKAKFAILTNGVEYRFYTDLDEQNIMDSKPFFTFQFTNLKDNQITELAKFQKTNFDVTSIMDTASELKYTNEIRNLLYKEFEEPSDAFITFILSNIYEGKKTQAVITKFKDTVQKSLNLFINEKVSDKLQAAMKTTSAAPEGKPAVPDEKELPEQEEPAEEKPQVITTEEEIEGYVTVKLMIKDVISPDRIFYRDNLSYFNILIDDNIRKWVCRLWLDGSKKSIQFNDETKTMVPIETVADVLNYKDELVQVVNKFV
ncbi:type I restriction enzyme HsdR N-terminal domain-containing protein [Bacillus sp. AGMB 02131]|uniref:Type I restriction enzyme HsdR N-terminal domain-containing protein n=1 Tax=Peribacillus faecalis TaxID=2772559 RepID=A0A927CWZ8_9BACI|nr:type I restriction endonuclease [Peribacillus faecalis]MBD3107500.1 type I restriction enzyme HsdR N-terminal domain-containing protein [Peribacillus faecalis]